VSGSGGGSAERSRAERGGERGRRRGGSPHCAVPRAPSHLTPSPLTALRTPDPRPPLPSPLPPPGAAEPPELPEPADCALAQLAAEVSSGREGGFGFDAGGFARMIAGGGADMVLRVQAAVAEGLAEAQAARARAAEEGADGAGRQ
jgi:hypothetical protein